MSTSDQNSNVDSQGRFWRISQWFPKVSPEIVAKLRAFHAELLFFNGRMNLISPKTEKNADAIHIADGILGSIVVQKYANIDEIHDIGSGNGIPGIVFALLYPTIRVKLVDADARKIEFLRHCISRLGLTNCTALQSRFEDLPAGSVRFAMSRGFASVSKVLLAARRVATPDCIYFHFKGPSWSTEVASIPSQILAHWEPAHVSDYRLPEGDATMSIVITKHR